MKKLILVLCVAVSLAACGEKTFVGHPAISADSSVAGTYVNSDGVSVTLNSDGTAVFANAKGAKLGQTATYHVEGNEIKMEGRVVQMSLMDDGSINGGAMFGKMQKK